MQHFKTLYSVTLTQFLGCYAQPAEERNVGTVYASTTSDPVKECRDRYVRIIYFHDK